MRHLYKGRKLKRTSSHRKALLRNLAASLFDSKRIVTTVAKAKELRPFAERIITRAINVVKNESENRLPTGQNQDLHNRRMIARDININRKSSDTTIERTVFDILIQDIAPKIIAEERHGGYTRIIKSGFRRGDAAETAIIELVDFGAEIDGKGLTKKQKAMVKAKKEIPAEKEKKAPAIETFEPETQTVDTKPDDSLEKESNEQQTDFIEATTEEDVSLQETEEPEELIIPETKDENIIDEVDPKTENQDQPDK